jgi:pyrroloquinoline quinone biosynthesis protein B
MNKLILIAALLCLFLFSSFYNPKQSERENPFVIVLGIAQDAGYPHAGCSKECCKRFYDGKEQKHFVSCLAVVDPVSHERFLFDCTPDFPAQLHLLDSIYPAGKVMDGIFITHAHIGHYSGLMCLGRESMNTKNIQVFAMPEMKTFLQNNGPWSLLVQLQNIELKALKADSAIRLNERISVTPFIVPHRHEFSETVGYKISTGKKSIIFIPDIDKWSTWNHNLVELVKDNDVLFLDGTFFHDGEIAGRNMSEIPHPFMQETMKQLENLPASEKSKIHFIHLNHTNPALINGSDAQQEVEHYGFSVAKELAEFEL